MHAMVLYLLLMQVYFGGTILTPRQDGNQTTNAESRLCLGRSIIWKQNMFRRFFLPIQTQKVTAAFPNRKVRDLLLREKLVSARDRVPCFERSIVLQVSTKAKPKIFVTILCCMRDRGEREWQMSRAKWLKFIKFSQAGPDGHSVHTGSLMN